MKICPKCQQQFPNGFQYCPNDTEHLIASEEYARRTKPTTSAPKIEPIERPPSIPIPPRSPEHFRARQSEPFRPELPRSEPVRPSQNTLRPDPPSFPRPPAGRIFGGSRAPTGTNCRNRRQRQHRSPRDFLRSADRRAQGVANHNRDAADRRASGSGFGCA